MEIIAGIYRWWNSKHPIEQLIIFFTFYFGISCLAYMIILGLLVIGGTGVASP